ncbi:MAG: holo-ACP synthase [Acidobacteriota bacterium]
MAILGIGLDVVSVERIARIHERRGAAFVHRICRPGECKPYREQALVEHLAGLFAAKEAMFKALGTGWGQGVGFRQVEVAYSPTGAPYARLHGAAAEQAAKLGATSSHLSITHERTTAAAVAILEGQLGPRDS